MEYALIGIRTDGDVKLIKRDEGMTELLGDTIDKALKEYPDHRILCIAKGNPLDYGLRQHRVVLCGQFPELQDRLVFYAASYVAENRSSFEDKLYSPAEQVISQDEMDKISTIKEQAENLEIVKCWLHGRQVSVLVEPHKEKDGSIEIKPLAVILDNQLFSELIPITTEKDSGPTGEINA